MEKGRTLFVSTLHRRSFSLTGLSFPTSLASVAQHSSPEFDVLNGQQKQFVKFCRMTISNCG